MKFNLDITIAGPSRSGKTQVTSWLTRALSAENISWQFTNHGLPHSSWAPPKTPLAGADPDFEVRIKEIMPHNETKEEIKTPLVSRPLSSIELYELICIAHKNTSTEIRRATTQLLDRELNFRKDTK